MAKLFEGNSFHTRVYMREELFLGFVSNEGAPSFGLSNTKSTVADLCTLGDLPTCGIFVSCVPPVVPWAPSGTIEMRKTKSQSEAQSQNIREVQWVLVHTKVWFEIFNCSSVKICLVIVLVSQEDKLKPGSHRSMISFFFLTISVFQSLWCLSFRLGLV